MTSYMTTLLLLITFSPDLANSTAPCIEGNTHCGSNLWKKPITASLQQIRAKQQSYNVTNVVTIINLLGYITHWN